jgi:hypothetical protein
MVFFSPSKQNPKYVQKQDTAGSLLYPFQFIAQNRPTTLYNAIETASLNEVKKIPAENAREKCIQLGF